MTNRIPQGIIPFQSPLSTVTIYTDAALQSQLHYHYWGKEDWHTILPNIDNSLSIQPSLTIHLSWNPAATTIAYDVRSDTAVITAAATIPLVSSLSIASISTAQQKSVASGPSPEPTTTNLEPARTSQPTESLSNTAQPKTSKPPKTDGLAAGAVAGIAIGCLAIGALLAGIILWFLWRRRKPTRHLEQEASGISLIQQEKGYSTHNASSARENTASMPISSPLPLPLEDKSISGEISKIGNSIKNHVQSYYHSGRVSPGHIDYDDVQALGKTLPISAGTLSTLLSNSATREVALRFCIAFVICGKMLPSRDSEVSLLPVEVAQSLRRMTDTDVTSRSKLRGYTG